MQLHIGTHYAVQPLTIGVKSVLRQSLLQHLYEKGQQTEIGKILMEAKLSLSAGNKYPGFILKKV